MIVMARHLKLRNIGQLAEFVTNGDTVMGRIERVKISRDFHTVTIRLSHENHLVDGDSLLNIIRSSELHEIIQNNLAIEDVLDQLVDA